MRRVFFIFIVLVVFLAWHVPAMADTNQELLEEMKAIKTQLDNMKALQERLNTLEEKLKGMEEVTTKAKAVEETIQKKKGTPVFSFWKNDFYFETPDGDFSMRVRGNVHFDTKMYGGQSANPTHFDVRRARIDFQGLFWKYIQFRVQPELADSPYIRNAWVDFKFRDWLHLRAGQMKPPFSTSWWTLDNNVNFLERGASTPLYPYFDRGWWVWGDVLNNTLTWNLGMFTGAGLELDYKKGDIDDHKDTVARLFYSPFKNDNGHVLEGLHLCLEGTQSYQSKPTSRFETGGFGAQVRDDRVYKWNATSYTDIGSRNRWGAEIHYIKGPFSLSSEYLETRYKSIEVFTNSAKTTKMLDEDGRITSWSTWVSYFLTGESKTVSNFGWRQPNPKVNFDPVNLKGPGAWEVLARYTHTEVGDNFYKKNGSYSIATGTPWTEEITLGVNWTWNPMVRWQLNYTHIKAADGTGPTGETYGLYSGSTDSYEGEKQTSNEDMLGLRMIFKF